MVGTAAIEDRHLEERLAAEKNGFAPNGGGTLSQNAGLGRTWLDETEHTFVAS